MDIAKPKKIVGLIHTLDLGGAQHMMVTILNYFVKEDFEVHLIVLRGNGIFLKDLSSNIIIHDLDMPSVGKAMYKFLKKIYEIKPNIVFSGIGHLNIALSSFIPFMKVLLPKTKWIARETSVVSQHNKTSKYPKLFDFLYRHSYKNYDVIVTQSDDMKQDLENNYFKSEKIVTINNPVDHEHIKLLANQQDIVLFDKEKVNLISVSGLRKEKRHDLMLQTLALLPEEYYLTILGSGEKEQELKKLCKKLNLVERVSFGGFKSNPYCYMKKADLFLLTSEREGLPNVLLEANSLGLPIVAFSCLGGIKEIITEGENGFYVPLYECELMAKKIKEASSYPFNKSKIIKDSIDKYSHSKILNEYKKLF